MRFLIDNALSFRVADLLNLAGHDALHVLSIELGAAPDAALMNYALREDRIIVSVDTDFGTLLAQQRTSKPSFILLRWPGLRKAEDQARILLANLPNVSDSLHSGAVVVIESERIRIRRLPISD